MSKNSKNILIISIIVNVLLLIVVAILLSIEIKRTSKHINKIKETTIDVMTLMPEEQRRFIEIISNEWKMVKDDNTGSFEAALEDRYQKLKDFFNGNLKIKDWYGKVLYPDSVGASQGGSGALNLEIVSDKTVSSFGDVPWDIRITTMDIRYDLDFKHTPFMLQVLGDSKINEGSKGYQLLKDLKKGDIVKFSGSFYLSPYTKRYILSVGTFSEYSGTLSGDTKNYIKNPSFAFKFTDLERYDVLNN
jgi:hypothetical protein